MEILPKIRVSLYISDDPNEGNKKKDKGGGKQQ